MEPLVSLNFRLRKGDAGTWKACVAIGAATDAQRAHFGLVAGDASYAVSVSLLNWHGVAEQTGAKEAPPLMLVPVTKDRNGSVMSVCLAYPATNRKCTGYFAKGCSYSHLDFRIASFWWSS